MVLSVWTVKMHFKRKIRGGGNIFGKYLLANIYCRSFKYMAGHGNLLNMNDFQLKMFTKVLQENLNVNLRQVVNVLKCYSFHSWHVLCLLGLNEG